MFKKKTTPTEPAQTIAPGEEEERDRGLWRDLVAYWILGLANNYGYVIMLSAAKDIIGEFHPSTDDFKAQVGEGRECQMKSTGVILLADIIPSEIMKNLLPFLPLMVHLRIFIGITCSVVGFVLVAIAKIEAVALAGVVVTSIHKGIGESSFLAYTAGFNKHRLRRSPWLYLIRPITWPWTQSKQTKQTLLIMLIIPTMEAFAFWILLRKPKDKSVYREKNKEEDPDGLHTFKDKCLYIVKALPKYIVPLMAVYFFQYFINLGLFQLVNYKNIFLDHKSQYRWLSVDYQIGVFIVRSTVNLVQIDKVWILTICQFINMLYFLTEVMWLWTPSIWISFAVVFWEGLVGGASYVNTFYKMAKQLELQHRIFAMGMVVTFNAYGITAAGFLAIPVHNAICRMPARNR